LGTQWSVAFTFNGAMLILQAFNFIMMAVGAFWFYPRLIGTFVNCCFGCCHLAAWAFALSVYANPLGQSCMLNIIGNQYGGKEYNASLNTWITEWSDDWTYQKDGTVLFALGTIQALMWCVQCFVCWIPLYSTPGADGGHSNYVTTMQVDK